MSTDTAGQLDLAVIRDRAVTATGAAQGFRDRAAAGDPAVNAAGLATAEAEERLARLQLDAAERRDAEQRERDAAARLEADRAAVQREWAAAHAPGVDAEVCALLAAAVDAAVVYVRAAQRRADDLDDLATRAQALGFRIEAPQQRSPLPALGRAIVDAATGVLPHAMTAPLRRISTHTVWDD